MTTNQTGILSKKLSKLPQPMAVLAVGIPGSGKSTIIRTLASTMNLTYISPDDIRAELTGDAAKQELNKEVWDMTYDRAKKALDKGMSVAVDATHVDKFRKSAVISYKTYGAQSVVAIVFDTPLKVAKQRNKSRERVVPEYALERMHQKLEDHPPSFDEGFTAILAVK